MKVNDPISEIRSVRKDISAECGHSSSKLVKHYIEYQKRFKNRMKHEARRTKLAV